jgi:hypothetical protein
VPAQVFHVEDLKPAALHALDRARWARNPATGEDVLANPVLGFELADVADEVNHAETSGLQGIGVRGTTA